MTLDNETMPIEPFGIEWHESEISRLMEEKRFLCDALKTIYSLRGEDQQLAKICNEALDKYDY